MKKCGKTRREFLKTALFGGAALSAGRSVYAQNPAGNETPQTRRRGLLPQPLRPENVHLSGEWGSRFMAATCNLMTRPDRYSLESFAANATSRGGALWPDWPGDQVGRWFSVLHIAEGYGWTPAAARRASIADVVLPLQTKEGNFGPPGSAGLDDSRIPSGNAFALRGLMDAYADTRESRYLEAARRLARYFESIAPAWETKRSGMLHEFYGHCLDGLAALFELAGDRWALDFARRLAGRVGRTPHTHHSLSLCRGLADLARLTGEKAHLDRLEDYLAWSRKSLVVTGGLPESMPTSEQDEGCGLADWVVVNLLMFQGTGEERYLDDAEHTLVNHFFMNQFVTGGFGHRALGHEVLGGKNWQGWEGRFGSENPGCCSMWGQWGLGQAARFIITPAGDSLLLNFYPSADIELPGRGIHLSLTSDFPRTSRVQIHVRCEKENNFGLALRVPPWAESMEVTRAGKSISGPASGRRLNLGGGWKCGETIEIRFKSGIRLVPWPAANPEGFGLFDGPLCLGLPDSAADVNLPWGVLVDGAGHLLLDQQGRPTLVEPSGRRTNVLTPISGDWQYPDVHNPRRWRVLFTKKAAA